MPGELPSHTYRDVRPVGKQLLDTWYRYEGSYEFRQRDRKPSPARFVCIFGLSAHVHRLVGVVYDLLDQNCVIESLPLIRLGYECAITAQWVAQAGDGAEAFVNESMRQRKAAALTFSSTSLPGASDAAKAVIEATQDSHPSSSDAQARNFEQLCIDLTPGGKELYAYYRLMSRYSHAGAYLVDSYLDPTSTGDDVAALRKVARTEGPDIWAFFATLSLVLAGRAVDFIEVSKARRSQLRASAKSLGVTSELQLTADARARIDQDLRVRRKNRPTEN